MRLTLSRDEIEKILLKATENVMNPGTSITSGGWEDGMVPYGFEIVIDSQDWEA